MLVCKAGVGHVCSYLLACMQVHVEAKRDPTRLLRGTAAHMLRVRENKENEREGRQAKDSSFILHRGGHRTVPSWVGGPAALR